jgi:1,5-anhydro-D-fructose reductase (1,5-anhydro-D-mannitol-forming)
MSDRRLGWGFIGASTIAGQYMHDAVRSDPRSAVTAILSSSQERADAFAAQHGVPAAYDSLDRLLADPAVDVVYVSTTNERHRDHVLAAARAGKQVLCEKPLAMTLDDAIDMRDACATAGVVMGTNHHLRHAPTHRTMHRLVADGAIGTPVAARVFHAVQLPKRLQTWRVHDPTAGGGVALDITVHDTDTLRFLLGDEVVEVTALATNQGLASAGLEDGMMGVMRFASGLLASFHDAFTVPHAGTGLELHGTEGSLIGRDVMTQEPRGEVVLRRDGVDEPIDVGPRESLYGRAVRQFNDAVLTIGTPSASAEDGLWSLAVGLTAAESCRTGQAVLVPNPLGAQR